MDGPDEAFGQHHPHVDCLCNTNKTCLLWYVCCPDATLCLYLKPNSTVCVFDDTKLWIAEKSLATERKKKHISVKLMFDIYVLEGVGSHSPAPQSMGHIRKELGVSSS